MAGNPPGDPEKSKTRSDPQRQNANALIATKLRGYYDGIIEEGTPAHLLDLLERLQDAETAAKKK
ncbi:MAG: NepR family anti-sigma factor [Rhizobium sp.]|nr:NepR family anti-sigma factor [Rhizobium sp.]